MHCTFNWDIVIDLVVLTSWMLAQAAESSTGKLYNTVCRCILHVYDIDYFILQACRKISCMSSSLPYLLHSKHRSLELCSLLLSRRFVIFVTAENWCLLVLRKSLEHESINQCTGAKCHFLSPRIDTKDASMKPLACASAWHEGSPLGSLVFKLFNCPYALC